MTYNSSGCDSGEHEFRLIANNFDTDNTHDYQTLESEGSWSGYFPSVPAQETYDVKFLLWSGEYTLDGYWFPIDSQVVDWTMSTNSTNSTESNYTMSNSTESNSTMSNNTMSNYTYSDNSTNSTNSTESNNTMSNYTISNSTESNNTMSGFDYDCDAPIEGNSTTVESNIPMDTEAYMYM